MQDAHAYCRPVRGKGLGPGGASDAPRPTVCASQLNVERADARHGLVITLIRRARRYLAIRRTVAELSRLYDDLLTDVGVHRSVIRFVAIEADAKTAFAA